MKGYTFCCGGIYFYLRGANFYGGCIITKGSIFVLWVYFLLWRDILLLGGGAFLWRGYGYCYEGMYFCVREILLLEGGTLRQRHKHNYFGVALGPRLAINEVHACAVYHLCTWKKVVSETVKRKELLVRYVKTRQDFTTTHSSAVFPLIGRSFPGDPGMAFNPQTRAGSIRATRNYLQRAMSSMSQGQRFTRAQEQPHTSEYFPPAGVSGILYIVGNQTSLNLVTLKFITRWQQIRLTSAIIRPSLFSFQLIMGLSVIFWFVYGYRSTLLLATRVQQ